jgi:hypothetical protein
MTSSGIRLEAWDYIKWRGFGRYRNEAQVNGVTLEHYDMQDKTRKNDVHIFGDMKVAWFKDPYCKFQTLRVDNGT